MSAPYTTILPQYVIVFSSIQLEHETLPLRGWLSCSKMVFTIISITHRIMVRFVQKKCKHLAMPQSELDHYVKKERASIKSLRGVRGLFCKLLTWVILTKGLCTTNSHDDTCLWATILQAPLRPCIESQEVDVIAILKN